MGRPRGDLSLAESGALALAEAAQALDRADDTSTFLDALRQNHRIWSALREIAETQKWSVPDRRQTEFVLEACRKAGLNDDEVFAMVAINKRVSEELAGGDIGQIRDRAYFIWESRGRPMGNALDHWLLAEMEMKGRH